MICLLHIRGVVDDVLSSGSVACYAWQNKNWGCLDYWMLVTVRGHVSYKYPSFEFGSKALSVILGS